MSSVVDFFISLSGAATVAVIVTVVVFAVLAYALIMRRGVTPVVRWGKLKIDFKRLGPRR